MASAQQLLNAALAQHRAGNLSQAEAIYRRVLEQFPEAADAWHLLGALCIQAQRPAEAVSAIEHAIRLNPNNADYYSHLGAAHGALKQHQAAIDNLRTAARLAPNSAAVHYNLGTALRNAGQIEAAVDSFRRSLQLEPSAAEAHYNLANALRDLKRYEQAESSYRAAMAARPNYLKAMINLGGVLNELRRRVEAVELLQAAVAIDPRHARARLNLGSILRDAGRLDEAATELERAVALNPSSAEAHNNLGTTYQARGEFERAGPHYRRALELDPQLPDAHFSLGTYLLHSGELAEGFAEYEWRWKCRAFMPRSAEKPRWNGEPLDGRTILLHAEQGLGDTLQFVRYAVAVKQRGGRVIVECQPPLVPLLTGCAGIDELVAIGQPLPAFDVYCPLMSLPGVLGLSESELWSGSYITADPGRGATWRERLAAVGGFRVGLCWQGNRQHLFDRQRSLPLEQLAPLAQVAGVSLVSLQKGEGSEQIAGCGFTVHELGDELDTEAAFLDTAAVIEQLDLVISADTAIAHLAGGLEAPVWILLSKASDWRWIADREDSPWYPSARLFRQTKLDDWSDVVENLARALRRAADERA